MHSYKISDLQKLLSAKVISLTIRLEPLVEHSWINIHEKNYSILIGWEQYSSSVTTSAVQVWHRGQQKHHDMKLDDFQRCKGDNGVELVQFTERQTKTRQGGLHTKLRDF